MSPPAERLVAGMKCSDVLAVLSDFLDGELDSRTGEKLLEHLRGCDWCERFGGQFRDVIETLRRELKNPEPLPGDVAAHLREALKRNE